MERIFNKFCKTNQGDDVVFVHKIFDDLKEVEILNFRGGDNETTLGSIYDFDINNPLTEEEGWLFYKANLESNQNAIVPFMIAVRRLKDLGA